MTTRPGIAALFRRLHLVHVPRDLPSWARRAIAETELDAEGRTRHLGAGLSTMPPACTCTRPSDRLSLISAGHRARRPPPCSCRQFAVL